MEQEKIIHIAEIERRARELTEQIQLIDKQISEFHQFEQTLSNLINNKENDFLASLGSRVYMSAKIEDRKKLFVEVGAGVLVQKPPKEILEIIESQMEKLLEVRNHINIELDYYHKDFEKFVKEAES